MDNDFMTNLKESIFGGSKKRTEINTDFLQIKDNSIYYCDTDKHKKENERKNEKKTVLQISSIAQVDAGPAPKLKIPIYAYLFLIGGLITMLRKGGLPAGILFLLIGSVIIYFVLEANNRAGDNLIIYLNNGHYYLFNFKDKAFLNRVFNAVMESIRDKGEGNMMININNGTISTIGDNNIVGDGNTVTGSQIGGTNNSMVYGDLLADINWDKLQAELLDTMKKLPSESEEYKAGTGLLDSILHKNKPGLIDQVKAFAASFSSSLFANAASSYLLKLIQFIIDGH